MRAAVGILTVIAIGVLIVVLVLPARGSTTRSDLGTASAGSAMELRQPDACIIPALHSDAATTASVVNGRRLFLRENCYICHGGRGGGGMCPNLREIGNSGNDEDLIETIHNGTPNGMPAYGRRLSDAQILDLVAYIRSLRSPAEPTFTIWWR